MFDPASPRRRARRWWIACGLLLALIGTILAVFGTIKGVELIVFLVLAVGAQFIWLVPDLILRVARKDRT